MNQDEVTIQTKHMIASICGIISGFLAIASVLMLLLVGSMGTWVLMYFIFVGAAILISIYVLNCSTEPSHKALAITGVVLSLSPLLFLFVMILIY